MATEHHSQHTLVGVDFSGVDYNCVDFMKLNSDVLCYMPLCSAVWGHFGFEPKAFQVRLMAAITEGEHKVFVIAQTNSWKGVLFQAVPVVKESTTYMVICLMLALMSD